MRLRKLLSDVARVVAEEAERNPDFAKKLADILVPTRGVERTAMVRDPSFSSGSRSKNRRPKAVLDPVEVARMGEQPLRARLMEFTLDQLNDIVADYGMDPGKLVMKWKAADKIIDRIVEISLSRAQKGDAFRSDG